MPRSHAPHIQLIHPYPMLLLTPQVLALKEVYLEDEHEQFHDYRKLLRWVNQGI